jgi:hypothetical protein
MDGLTHTAGCTVLGLYLMLIRFLLPAALAAAFLGNAEVARVLVRQFESDGLP